MSGEVTYMDVAEFRRLGYVQEINRIFLHPLGLALEVSVDEEGAEQLSGVWDCRADPEGIYFGDVDDDMTERADSLLAEYDRREGARVAALGYMVQPLC